MSDVFIERALYRRERSEEPRLLAKSPSLVDGLLPPIVEVLTAFGERPPGMTCPAALFAVPLRTEQPLSLWSTFSQLFRRKETSYVAVVQVADGAPDANGWAALQFFVLVLAKHDYETLGGDPFALARRLLPTETLDTATLPAEPLKPTGVEDVRAVLKRIKANALPEGADPNQPLTAENAESPTLLGGVQVLVDGGKLVFERPKPDPSMVEALWTLLPYRMRPRLWPATFAFANHLGFDVVVTPHLDRIALEGYMTETQAGDYPQGSYELALQTAAESGDARDLDTTFRRRSSSDTFWLGVKLLVGLCLIVLATNLIPKPKPDVVERATTAAGAVAIKDPWAAIEAIVRGNEKFLKR